MAVIDIIKEKAKADKKTVVLPESMDRRTWVAAEKILKEGLANLIIIGTPEDIGEHSKGLDVSGATIINPQTYEKTQAYIDLFVELRKAKGMTPEKARETILSDYAYYGCLMIKMGDADGMVSGACHSTANTLRPCLQVIKTKPGTKQDCCFFLIGAPLGAIIRKGGLGMPIVISIGFFVIYYIISISGEKMAKEGTWEAVYGMWLSSFILTPIAVYLTYKATNDSGLLDVDWYIGKFKKIKEKTISLFSRFAYKNKKRDNS